MIFYIGLHQPSDAKHFRRAFISVNRLKFRVSVGCPQWIMDSGAFTEISTYGFYRSSVDEYAQEINRWCFKESGLIAAISQDYMCEPWIVKKTGLSIRQHQTLTIERYDKLLACNPLVEIIPVLQGYEPRNYIRHLHQYGDRLKLKAYVGVGSICKRNRDINEILSVLLAIKAERPDLRLHGFGLKLTALSCAKVRRLLYSADSMAWSYSARYTGGQNSWREAATWLRKIQRINRN
jgi:hypothetical protein